MKKIVLHGPKGIVVSVDTDRQAYKAAITFWGKGTHWMEYEVDKEGNLIKGRKRTDIPVGR